MSDVVVSVTESTTTVAVTENSVNVAVTETPVAVSASSAGLQGATGAQGPKGDTGATGAGGTIGYYGSFESTQSQTNGGYATNSQNLVTFNTTSIANGISVSGGTVTFANPGTYLANFLGQFITTGGGSNYQVNVWYQINGSAVANAGYVFTTGGVNNQVLANVEDTLVINAGDTLAFYWSSQNQYMQLQYVNAGTAPTRPASPSAKLNILQTTYTQAGPTGATGPAGTGVPTGGTAGQVLAKIDGTNYNTQWVDAASGTPNYAVTAGTAYFATTAGTVVYAQTSGTAATISGSITKSQVSDFTSGTVAYSTASGTANTAGTAYFATTAGTATFATTAGTAVSISSSITRSQVSDYAGGTVAHGTADPFLTGDNAFTGQNTFTPTNASSTALRVVGQPSQGAPLQDWRSSSASLVSIAADGALSLPSASITASGVASFAQTTITSASTAVKTLVVNAPTGQATNIQEWQVGGTVQSRIATNGLDLILGGGAYPQTVSVNYGYTNDSTTQFRVQAGAASKKAMMLQASSGMTADLLQYQTLGSAVLGGRNAVGQIFAGSTTGLTTAVGGATLTATSAAGTATITTTSAHNIGSGDLVVVAGITPTGFNGTYVVTAVPSATAISYVNATAGPQTVAGTISVYAQTSIVARSAATTGAVVRGATSQASNLQEWQNNAGSILAAVRSDGKFKISTNNVATTVGATGTASALPALPVGYVQIDVGGTLYKMPYYNN